MNDIRGANPVETEQEGAKPASEESDDDILKEARDRYEACTTAESDNRMNALDDLRFLAGEQWPLQAKQARAVEGRPCLTINKLPTFLHQVTNDQRMNKPSIKVHPVDDDADIKTAEVIQGLIRHIEYDSNADVAYDTAVNCAAANGFGYLRLVTEYESEKSFDQKICFKRVRNPLSVHIDPLSQEPDGSDMRFAFVDSIEDREEFKRQYPDAEANNTDLVGQDLYKGWFTENTVLVTEYYRIKEISDTLCLCADGAVHWKTELPAGTAKGYVLKERPSYRCEVQWFKITGSDVLERTVIAMRDGAKWIPVFPVYGDEIDIEGKVVRSGLVRNAKDPAQMYNYWMTSATEEVSLRPKVPYIMAEGQDEGYEGMWASANSRSYAALFYKPVTVEGVLAPPPQRQPMADVPAGVLAMAMHANDNIKSTTGLFDSSLGARGNATSGKQEIAQQRQGDIATFHYTDNLNRTVRHIGRCLVSMIPNYYDGARMVRILGEDETAEAVKINQPMEVRNPKVEGGLETVIHDITVGQYDVTVSSGPSYSTLRQEAVDGMIQTGNAWPKLWEVAGDKMVKAMDWPGAEEIAERIRKTIPPAIRGNEEDADDLGEPMVPTPEGPIPMSQVPQLIAQLGQALQNADEMLKKAGVDKVETEKAKVSLQAKELDLKDREIALQEREIEVKAFQAETERLAAKAKAENDEVMARTAAIKAEADAVRSHAESVRARMEADVAPEQVQALPTVEELARIIAESRQTMPAGMSIKSPVTGQTYEVVFRT